MFYPRGSLEVFLSWKYLLFIRVYSYTLNVTSDEPLAGPGCCYTCYRIDSGLPTMIFFTLEFFIIFKCYWHLRYTTFILVYVLKILPNDS